MAWRKHWSTIDTAPRDGTPIFLRSEEFDPRTLFHWDAKTRTWRGFIFHVARRVPIYWDNDAPDQPTHWRPSAEGGNLETDLAI